MMTGGIRGANDGDKKKSGGTGGQRDGDKSERMVNRW